MNFTAPRTLPVPTSQSRRNRPVLARSTSANPGAFSSCANVFEIAGTVRNRKALLPLRRFVDGHSAVGGAIRAFDPFPGWIKKNADIHGLPCAEAKMAFGGG